MSLPIDLVQEFAKSTFDPDNKIKETDCYGTAQKVDGNWFVKLDGSSELTPAAVATGVANGDRVLVRIKNRKATIIGNITNPVIMASIIKANTGIIVQGYLTTNENRTVYNDQKNFGLTFSSGGMGSYGGNNKFWYVTADGKLYANSAEIVGKITASSGYLGTAESGFTIDSTGIYTGIKGLAGSGYITLSAADFSKTVASKSLTNWRFTIGSAFGVTNDGKLYSSSADLIGRITATSGYIGNETNGFKIDSSGFYSGANKTGAVSGYISLSNVDFARTIGGTPRYGLRFAIGDSFGVTAGGALYASGVNISGTFSTKDATIGDFTVKNAIYSGEKASLVSDKTGVYLGSDGISLGANSPFRVTSSGALTATSGTIGGWNLNSTRLYATSGGKTSGMQIPGANTVGAFSFAAGATSATGWSTAPFRVTHDGKLYASGVDISGTITASSGKIGAFSLTTSGALYTNGKSTFASTAQGFYIGSDGLSIGTNQFKVTSAGALSASGVDISGKVKASEGSIGNFTLGNALYSGTTKTTYASTAAGVYIGTDGIAMGQNNPFKVDSNGNLTASKATITGVITANSGKIGAFTLNTNGQLYYGKASLDDNKSGFFLSSGGIALGANSVFKVDSNGNLTASKATISGVIHATTLTLDGKIPSSKVDGLPDFSIYIAKDGTIGSTPAAGATGFKVSSAGALTASNVVVYGTIYASAGNIGNFTLKSGKLYSNNHVNYDSDVDGIYINSDYISFGKGGKFYVGNSGIVYCNGGEINLNFVSSNNSITSRSGLYFRVNKGGTAVGGLGYSLSLINNTYYGDVYFYTTGTNKNIVIKTYNNLNLYAGAINIGKSSEEDITYYGRSAATSSVTLLASSYVRFTTTRLLMQCLDMRLASASNPFLTFTSTTANVGFRVNGYSTSELGIGIPPATVAPGAIPSPTIGFSLYASGNNYGLYYHVLNGSGSKWLLWTAGTGGTLNCNAGFTVTGGHLMAISSNNSEFALVSENTYGRIHCTVSGGDNGGLIGLYARGYKAGSNKETNNFSSWIIYMKYNDSTTVYTDKQIKANGTILTGGTSDIRLKENIKDTEITSGLSLINKIQLRSFTWKHAYNNEYAGDRWKIGMIADELELLDPKLTLGGGWEDEEHTKISKKSINTFYLQGYIIKGIQELSTIYESHEDRIRRLETENEKLKAELLKLKGAA